MPCGCFVVTCFGRSGGNGAGRPRNGTTDITESRIMHKSERNVLKNGIKFA